MVLAAFLQLSVDSVAAPAAGKAGGSNDVRVEQVSGSSVPQITLSSRAAERLGITTDFVSKRSLIPRMIVGGQIQSVSTDEGNVLLVKARLFPGELENIDRERPALVWLPAPGGNKGSEPVEALAYAVQETVQGRVGLASIYYRLPKNSSEFQAGDLVRVELDLGRDSGPDTVVPYSAIYYDAYGATWVYIVIEPLVYRRQEVKVERIQGDWAVLLQGLPIGAEVVTTGAALLFGTEIFDK